MAVVMILHRLVSGKYFLQSGLRVLELLVKMDMVYEDKDKIILNKPAGQLSQSGKSFEMDLVSEVLTYRKSKGEEDYATIINRLDRPVSGLVLMAKNKKEAARLSLLMQKETLCKLSQNWTSEGFGSLDVLKMDIILRLPLKAVHSTTECNLGFWKE